MSIEEITQVTNKTAELVLWVFLGAIFFLLVGCILSRDIAGREDPVNVDPLPAEFSVPYRGQIVAIEGKAISSIDAVANSPQAVRGPGFAIDWEGIAEPGMPALSTPADPLDVLRACASRMSALQGSPRGSDQNAQALFAVLQAIDSLEGTTQVSASIEGEK